MSVLATQDDGAGVSGESQLEDFIKPQADHPGLPLVGRDACQRKYLGAGKDFAGQGHNRTPNAICRVALQRE